MNLTLVSSFLLVLSLLSSPSFSLPRPVSDRVDCHPDPDSSLDSCEARGCIYEEVEDGSGAPWCYYPEEYGYKIYGEIVETERGFVVDITKAEDSPQSIFPGEFVFVRLEAEFQTQDRLRIRIQPNVPRYQVPVDIPRPDTKANYTQYEVQITDDPVFAFRVIRRNSGAVIFDSGLGGLTLSQQFLQIGARIPSENLFGFGEHELQNFKRDMQWKTWGMFAIDRAPVPELALYGTHPYYMVVEDNGDTHSVLFLNSNAQEVALTPAPGIVYRTIGMSLLMAKPSPSYSSAPYFPSIACLAALNREERVAGAHYAFSSADESFCCGVLDMYFFLGPTPEDATRQYTAAIGRHEVPAYWSLGFHLCRWGYNNTESMAAAHQRMRDAGIPQDGQWGDIDVMDRRLDFTYDEQNFRDLPDFIENTLHANGQRFVMIIDPGVPIGEPEGSYPPLEEGDARGVWVLDHQGEPIMGQVWPDNPTKFPDFTNPMTHQWWSESIAGWRQKIAFDGLWIDMNEPTNFVNGTVEGCQSNDLNYPPYLPKVDNDDLLWKTLCMDAQHFGGTHYDTHSMYGWWEAVATKPAIRNATAERGLVVSRSTFIGSGHYASHWLGDNWSKWDNLKTSIVGILQFNQFGIPLVGADICGFFDNTTEELCARWQQLGAFYPFSRNHNELDTIDQDPAQWPTVAAIARDALMAGLGQGLQQDDTRYRFLPYLYSLFHRHNMDGDTVARALWHEFPSDPVALTVDEQFLWGKYFMVSPALSQGQTSVRVYFPSEASWYDLGTHAKVPSAGFLDLDCPLEKIHLHIRAGGVLPTQPPELTTTESRRNDFELLVVLDDLMEADGELFWDDGVSVDAPVSHVVFTHRGRTLTSSLVSDEYEGLADLSFDKINFWGVNEEVQEVHIRVNGIEPPSPCSWFQPTSTELMVDCSGSGTINAMSDWEITWETQA